jgi:hypothetical protein
VLPGIGLEATIENATSGNNGSISVSHVVGGSSSGYQYLWSNGQTSQSISGLAPGTYGLTVTEDGGCSTSYQFTVEGASATTETGQNVFGAVIVPNPSNANGATLSIKSLTGEVVWAVFDATGRQMASGNTDRKTISLPKELPSGTYSVTLQDGNQRAVLRWVVL